jgi:hypothetical protein
VEATNLDGVGRSAVFPAFLTVAKTYNLCIPRRGEAWAATDIEYWHQTRLELIMVAIAFSIDLFDRDDMIWARC